MLFALGFLLSCRQPFGGPLRLVLVLVSSPVGDHRVPVQLLDFLSEVLCTDMGVPGVYIARLFVTLKLLYAMPLDLEG